MDFQLFNVLMQSQETCSTLKMGESSSNCFKFEIVIDIASILFP